MLKNLWVDIKKRLGLQKQDIEFKIARVEVYKVEKDDEGNTVERKIYDSNEEGDDLDG